MGAVAATKTVVDTSVLIADETEVHVEGLVAVSAASLAELHFGVLIAKDPTAQAQRLRRLTQVQAKFPALAFDEDVAASYGQLAAATVRASRQVRRRRFDLVIAATALAHGARLATLNPQDVQHLADVIEIVNPIRDG